MFGTLAETVARWNTRLEHNKDRSTGYRYSLDDAAASLEQLRAALGLETRLLVSLKANPNPDLLAGLASTGTAFDVSSRDELDAARAVNAAYTSWVGPGKSRRAIADALAKGCDQIVLESEREVRVLAELVRESVTRPSTLLRVNPANYAGSVLERMGGLPSPFGVDSQEVNAVLEVADELDLQVDGFHYFLGSGAGSLDDIEANLDIAVVDCFQHLAGWGPGRPVVLNLGGGLGVPMTLGDPGTDHHALAELWRYVTDRVRREIGREVSFQFEAGRFVYADAGVYLCEVVEVKRSQGTVFAIVDVGISGFSRPAMPWAQPHPIWRLGDEVMQTGGQRVTVVGPTCLPADRLASGVALPRDLAPGDVLVCGNAGAYGRSMSLRDWGSLPPVQEIVL